jgi:DNA-binding CsgD family transcriptional regulator
MAVGRGTAMAEQGEPLSEREQAVLEKMADGLTNREIARDLFISPNTVKVHVRNIFNKLAVSTRTEATTVAIQKGLLALPGAGAAPEGEAEAIVADTGEAASTTVGAPDEAGQSQAMDTAVPATVARPWRPTSLGMILAVGLLIGAVVTAWLLGRGAERAPTGEVEAEDAFQVEALGDTNWRTARPLPTARADMAVASIGLDLYIIGGQVEAGVINLVDVYETDSHHWLAAASKPTAVAQASAAVLFGEIYVPGGRLVDGTPTAIVEAYSPTNNAWRPVTPLPVPVAGGLALSDGSNLYLFGGWDGEQYLNSGYVYDPAAEVWQGLPPMAFARADAAGDVMGDHLFVVGGYDGQEELSVCEFFVWPEQKWLGCADMAAGRAGAGASAQGSNALFVFGGGRKGGVPGGEQYNLLEDSWSPVEMPMIPAGGSWYDLGVAAVETHIFALGGRQGESIVADNYTYIHFIQRSYLPSVGGGG